MTRRTQQGSVARCPWCEASLPHEAPECPECRFPLTMAAAEGGFRTARQTSTSSTATPTYSLQPLPAGNHSERDWSHHVEGRAHRIRMVLWLTGFFLVLLLTAGVAAVVSTSQPGARSDAEATTSLLSAFHIAAGGAAQPERPAFTTVSGDQPSVLASVVSADSSRGLWYGTAQSTSGRCFLLAARISDSVQVGRGTLAKDEPCTAAQVRAHLEAKLLKSADG